MKIGAPRMNSNAPINLRGYFDEIKRVDDSLFVSGWVFAPESPIDEIRIASQKHLVGAGQVYFREDIARYIPWSRHAGMSGFSVKIENGNDERGVLEVLAYRRGDLVGQMRSWYDLTCDNDTIVPPLDLIERVAGMRNAAGFKMEGYKLYGEFRDAIERHTTIESGALLDWGCGCGRTIRYWATSGMLKVYGCDIDDEAVEWCRGNVKNCAFTTIPVLPPTEYDRDMFDIVTSCSVLTHLDRDTQLVWLQEMSRILKPGGLFLASVHGPSAALFAFPPDSMEKPSILDRLTGRRKVIASRIELDHIGILDQLEDHALGNVAPPGYYRSTFQSIEYTMQSWSKWFDVLEYTQRGIGNNQDLVVAKNRG